jgi:hypothetical protein
MEHELHWLIISIIYLVFFFFFIVSPLGITPSDMFCHHQYDYILLLGQAVA